MQMLTHLRIENFAIIDRVELDFSSGLTVLTGETGAGKSIIVDAIALLLGRSASDDLIKTSEQSMVIEGVFKLSSKQKSVASFRDYLDEDQDELIILRRLTRGKGSIARINGQTIPLKVLKQLVTPLAAIIGQHEHLSLFDEELQLTLLDSFSNKIKKELDDYKACFFRYKDIQSKLSLSQQDQSELIRKTEFLDFQIKDIAEHDFQQKEDEDLERQRKEMKNLNDLNDSIVDLITNLEKISLLGSESISKINKLSSIDPECGDLGDYIESLPIEIDERLSFLKNKQQDLAYLSEASIDDIESRLDLIFRFKKKYKVNSILELLDLLAALRSEKQKLESGAASTEQLEVDLQSISNLLSRHSQKLSEERKAVSAIISLEIKKKMHGLNFDQCAFNISVENIKEYGVNGADDVSFLVSTNPGEPLKPIQKVASGGELSRIMLAIKAVFIKQNPVNTLIFDEVDTGVGGVTAVKIGEYLKLISVGSQVLCVTHLPQIAKFATSHYVVNKEATVDSTKTTIRLLAAAQAQKELQRMVGGKEVVELIK